MKYILDVDTGIDDSLAIATIIGTPNAQLVGITTTFGNVCLDVATKNTLELLALLKADIPVYLGAKKPLICEGNFIPKALCELIHGRNGVGNVALEPSSQKPEDQDAVSFIIDMANKYGKELTLIPVGPLTNLAMVLRKDPEFSNKIGRVVIMGGALTVPGNDTFCSEANIKADPEAAKEVFESPLHLTMVGLDVTQVTRVGFDFIASLKRPGNVISEKLTQMMDHYCDWHKAKMCALHDPLAAAVALQPELVTTFPINLTTETANESRGRTIADMSRFFDLEKTTDVCLTVDKEAFLNLYVTALNNVMDRAEHS